MAGIQRHDNDDDTEHDDDVPRLRPQHPRQHDDNSRRDHRRDYLLYVDGGDYLDDNAHYVLVRRDDYDKLVAIVHQYDGPELVDSTDVVDVARDLIDHVNNDAVANQFNNDNTEADTAED